MFARIFYMLIPKRREKYIENLKITQFKEMYLRVYYGLLANGMIPKRLNVGLIFLWITNQIIQISGVAIVGNTMYLDILKADYSDATRQMTILFLIIMMLIKISSLVRHRPILGSLLLRLDEDYEDANKTLGESDLLIIKSYAMWGIWLSDLWCVLVVGSGTVFWWAAFILMFYSLVIGEFQKQMLFDCILPIWDDLKFVSPFYEMVFIYEMFLDIFVMTLYTGFDPIVPIFLMHVCAQLELVKRHLATLFDEEKKNDPAKIQQELCWIVKKLQRIYRYGNKINNEASHKTMGGAINN